MVATKRFRAHERCQARIQKYLEANRDGSSRVVDKWCYNLGRHINDWAATMDRTRAFAGNDRPAKRGKAVMYNHFILSPDPADRCDVDTMREYVDEWVKEWFGDEWGPGRLGQYQVAVVLHDDNEQGILHAHIVINNTDLQTARRLQISNRDNKQLVKRAQEIGLRHGLNPVIEDGDPEELDEPTRRKRSEAILDSQEYIDMERGRSMSKGERELLERGAWSWKAELSSLIDVALYTSDTEGDFVANLSKLGVVAEYREGQFLFRHPSNPMRFAIRGDRLGEVYERSFIDGTLAERRDSQSRRASSNWNRAHEITAEFIVGRLKGAPVDVDVSIEDLAEALKIVDLEGMRSSRRAGDVLVAAEIMAEAASDPEEKAKAEERVDEIRKAVDIAKRFGIFKSGDALDAKRAYEFKAVKKAEEEDAAKAGKSKSAAQGKSQKR